MAGAGVGGAGARGGGHLGISGTLGGVSILGPEPLCREKLWGQKQELYQWMYVRWVGPLGAWLPGWCPRAARAGGASCCPAPRLRPAHRG